MGQLFQSKDCPICGKPMVMALPPGGKGSRILTCIECDGPDPLRDKRASGWLKGELGRRFDPDA
jgi:hypothetical protein